MDASQLRRFTVRDTVSILDAALNIINNKSRGVVVLNETRVVGIISEGDILRAILQGVETRASIKTIINYNFHHIEEVNFVEAGKIFQEHGVSLVPVITPENCLADIITIKDYLEIRSNK